MEKMMVATARLTQRGHKINCLDDFWNLYNAPYKQQTAEDMAAMPHGTIKRYGMIHVVIVGGSRRFLAQARTHQVGVNYTSGSMQYSDYTDRKSFCIPYEMTKLDEEREGHAQYVDNYHTTQYLNSCFAAQRDYEKAVAMGVPHDAAAYMLPMGSRNVLIISATAEEWAHIISQRTCNRNSLETQYIFLLIWEQLAKLSPLFKDAGPVCMRKGLRGMCFEGKMSCGNCPQYTNPTDFLDDKFMYIRSE